MTTPKLEAVWELLRQLTNVASNYAPENLYEWIQETSCEIQSHIEAQQPQPMVYPCSERAMHKEVVQNLLDRIKELEAQVKAQPVEQKRALGALEGLDKSISSLLSNATKKEVFGIPFHDVETIRAFIQAKRPAPVDVDRIGELIRDACLDFSDRVILTTDQGHYIARKLISNGIIVPQGCDRV